MSKKPKQLNEDPYAASNEYLQFVGSGYGGKMNSKAQEMMYRLNWGLHWPGPFTTDFKIYRQIYHNQLDRVLNQIEDLIKLEKDKF